MNSDLKPSNEGQSVYPMTTVFRFPSKPGYQISDVLFFGEIQKTHVFYLRIYQSRIFDKMKSIYLMKRETYEENPFKNVVVKQKVEHKS